jgi:ketol-acid reductoisomerase
MKKLLTEIQNGIFAKNFIEENKTGRKNLDAIRRQEAKHPIEEIGSKLRAPMTFLNPIIVNDNTSEPASQRDNVARTKLIDDPPC